MPAPTRVARLASALNSTTTPKTAGTFNITAGDVVVVKVVGADGGTFSTPTGLTGATWTQKVTVGTSGSSGRVTIWTTTAPSTVSGVTISVARASGTDYYGIEVIQYDGTTTSGIGQVWSGGISSGSGTPSVTATSSGANSTIEMATTDWIANATTGKTYRTADAGAFTETAAALVGGQYTYYLGYHADSGAAASKTIGLSAPSGQRWTLGGVEILGPAGGPTQQEATGTAAVAVTSVGMVTARSAAAGTAAVALSVAATGTARTEALGTATSAIVASGAATARAVASGTSAVVLAAAGAATGRNEASSAATVTLSTSGATTARTAATGTAAVTSGATGAATAQTETVGSAVTAVTAAAAATAKAETSGTSAVTLTATGSATVPGTVNASGTAAISATATGGATARIAASGTVTLLFTAAGAPFATVATAGMSSITTNATGTATTGGAAEPYTFAPIRTGYAGVSHAGTSSNPARGTAGVAHAGTASPEGVLT